jgi:hypothetical protein
VNNYNSAIHFTYVEGEVDEVAYAGADVKAMFAKLGFKTHAKRPNWVSKHISPRDPPTIDMSVWQRVENDSVFAQKMTQVQ